MNNFDIFGVDQIYHHGDTNTYMQFHGSDLWRVVTGGGERLEVSNTEVLVSGKLNVGGLINKSTADTVVITQNDVPILSTFKATGTDGENTFVGRSGNTTLTGSTSSTQGSYNTAIGQGALTSLTTGFTNSAIG
jgi:hypothetical protein